MKLWRWLLNRLPFTNRLSPTRAQLYVLENRLILLEKIQNTIYREMRELFDSAIKHRIQIGDTAEEDLKREAQALNTHIFKLHEKTIARLDVLGSRLQLTSDQNGDALSKQIGELSENTRTSIINTHQNLRARIIDLEEAVRGLKPKKRKAKRRK